MRRSVLLREGFASRPLPPRGEVLRERLHEAAADVLEQPLARFSFARAFITARCADSSRSMISTSPPQVIEAIKRIRRAFGDAGCPTTKFAGNPPTKPRKTRAS